MRIGVLTSGGDSPGMNAAVRSIAVTGISRRHTVLGVRYGYDGLLDGNAYELDAAAVDGISRLGGTILGSARSAAFPTPEGQQRVRESIKKLGLDALVVVGGSGSMAGAHLLAKDKPCLVIGIPASIDNDIGHCGLAIGVDTAVNTIVEACDRISDTARAHRRAFIVEVMGRHCGFLAMRAGLAAEADAILYNEGGATEDETIARLEEVLRKAFSSSRPGGRALILKAEGVKIPTSRLTQRLGEFLQREVPGVDIRETILGHVVRGGNPSAQDRMISQRMGYASVLGAEKGIHDVMVSWEAPDDVGMKTPDRSVRIIPIQDVLDETKCLLDGTSTIMRRRVEMLKQVESVLAL